MTDDVYFFDSYAVIELIEGNPNFDRFLDCQCMLTQLNVFEIYTSVLRDWGEEKANECIETYFEYIIPYGPRIIKEASKFRLLHKKRDMSMTDCIGYILALRLGIKFLTGDKEFKDFKNVEFVK